MYIVHRFTIYIIHTYYIYIYTHTRLGVLLVSPYRTFVCIRMQTHTMWLAFIVHIKRQIGADIDQFKKEYIEYFERNKSPEHKMLDTAPRYCLCMYDCRSCA